MSEESSAKMMPGTICWNELCTPDRAGSIDFYSKLMGWTVEDLDLPNGMTYSMFKQGDTMIAGCVQPEDGSPPMWMSYILVEDLDASTAKAKELGANIMVERVDLPMGSFVVFADPQGAIISFWESHETDS